MATWLLRNNRRALTSRKQGSRVSGRRCDYGPWSTGGSGEAEGADMAGFVTRGGASGGRAFATARTGWL